MRKEIKHTLFSCLWVMLISGCAIKNDIPYPTVEAEITSIEVEGQSNESGTAKAAAVIDKSSRKVTLYVDDLVDVSSLSITKMEVSNNASITPDENSCINQQKFPTEGFSTIPMGSDTRVNFTKEATFTLSTYQDYRWTVSVKQIIIREVEVDNQVGNAVIDPISRNVVIYVTKSQDLGSVKVRKFNIGGQHGTVVPDPTKQQSYDFSSVERFYVSPGWNELSTEWKVFVYQTEDTIETTASAFARTTSATVRGNMQNGSTPTVEYRESSSSSWITLPLSNIKTSTSSYTADIPGLKPSTTYSYRVTSGGIQTQVQSFSTSPAQQLENGDFEQWYQIDKLYCPWKEGGAAYWDTGNKGATTVGASNVTPSSDTPDGKGLSASLQSKYIVIKFAAGSIFTGNYIRTDGTNGVLEFGREFKSFPTSIEFDYKFSSSPINRIGDSSLEYMKGQPDSCNVYCLLGDWDEPLTIKTRPTERQLVDFNDSHIIAYGNLTKGEDVPSWTHHKMTLEYRDYNRTPNYIIVVASSSKYGDYFTGGDQSLLYVDNFNLVYE